MRNELSKYYSNEFGNEYAKFNKGKNADIKNLLYKLDDESIVLHYHYIHNNKNPLGNKHKLNDAKDGSRYSRIHNQYPPQFVNLLKSLMSSLLIQNQEMLFTLHIRNLISPPHQTMALMRIPVLVKHLMQQIKWIKMVFL